jgi:hypothetical protein
MNANVVIAKVVSDNASSNGYVVKLDEENVQKLVSLFYIKIGMGGQRDGNSLKASSLLVIGHWSPSL